MAEPAGIVMPFAGTVEPQGYLFCDGSAVSRDTYAALFAVIGTTYGSGDGSTTFNLPDLTGRVVIGVSGTHALGTTGGEASHALLSTEMPEHHHEVPQHGHGNDIAMVTPTLNHTISTQPAFNYNKPKTVKISWGNNAPWVWMYATTPTATRTTDAAVADHDPTACTMAGAVSDCAAMTSGSTGTGAAHTNMQPYAVTKYIICTGE